MNRSPFQARWTILLLSILIITMSNQNTRAADVTLEDSQIRATFDSATGALTGLERKSPHWVIERRPELGVSFRLHAPLPNRRDNFVLGSKQKAAKVEKVSDSEVRIEWSNLLSEHGGVLPITFTADVTLKDGALTFNGKLDNQSSLVVETLEYPFLGDLSCPTRETQMHARTMWYGNLDQDEIYPNFSNGKGYWGDDVPTKTMDSYRSLFCLIQAGNQQGLYVEMHDPTQPYLIEYTFEQYPGVISDIGNNVPRHDTISGHPVHLEFRTTHFIFTAPKNTKTLAPVVLQCYNGDWHGGVDLYKAWRSTWYKQPHIPSWAMDVHSWQQLQINSPEDEWRSQYKDLTKYGDECAANGVSAIQLVGWNKGGQDGGDPAQDIDPAMGTWQDLHDAIAYNQSKGVHMIMFAKLLWADKTTDFYKNELYKYACTDPFGIPYEHGGYSYHTPTQLAAINNHRRAVMDFCDPAYRDIATKEFQKILNLGADGWLFDEVCHHGVVKYSFAPDHGYTPPGFEYGADMPFVEQLHAAADKVNPNFLFSGEGPQDWLMQYYPLSYFRIGAGSVPVCRYIDPHAPLMVAVVGFDDREMLNLILLDRYIISYEPYNFKGHLTDFPLTLAYGKKIDALRKKYKAYIWDADFQDNLGAKVTADGGVRYSVFKRSDGKRAVIVVNDERSKSINAIVALPNPGTLMAATPEDPDAKPTDGTLTIPARSAAVIMEQ